MTWLCQRSKTNKIHSQEVTVRIRNQATKLLIIFHQDLPHQLLITKKDKVLSRWGILRIMLWVQLKDCNLKIIAKFSYPNLRISNNKHIKGVLLSKSILRRAPLTMLTRSLNKIWKTSRKFWNWLRAKLPKIQASRPTTTNNPFKGQLKMGVSWKKFQSIQNNNKMDLIFLSHRPVNNSNNQEGSMLADIK